MFGNKWPIGVTIINERANGGYTVEQTRAQRVVTIEGKTKYILKKGKRAIPPVLYKYITNDNHLFLFCDKSDNFAPMTPQNSNNNGVPMEGMGGVNPLEVEPAKLVGIETNVKNWIIDQLKEEYNLWQNPSFWAKYSHFIISIGAIIGVGVMIYITLDGLSSIVSAAQNAANMMVERGCAATGSGY